MWGGWGKGEGERLSNRSLTSLIPQKKRALLLIQNNKARIIYIYVC